MLKRTSSAHTHTNFHQNFSFLQSVMYTDITGFLSCIPRTFLTGQSWQVCAYKKRKSPARGTCLSVPSRRQAIVSKSIENGSENDDKSIWDAAFASGAELRNNLRQLAEERDALRLDTERRLNEMSSQLAQIVDAVREEAGMPPVANPPSTPKSASQVSTSQSFSASKSNSAQNVGDEDSTSTDEPYMDPSNFGFDSAAGWQVLASENQLPVIDESGVKFRVECDKDGCSIIELQGNAQAGPGVRSQFLHSGPGFRVGYDPDGPSSFCGTIGNEYWLLALSRDEIRHFKRLCLALQKKMDHISKGLDQIPEQKPAVRRSGDGMFNERVGRTGSDCSVELESKLLWVQAFGKPELGQFAIRAIFMEGRQSESYWAANIVPGLLSAVSKLLIE